jgi:hypothetical protein
MGGGGGDRTPSPNKVTLALISNVRQQFQDFPAALLHDLVLELRGQSVIALILLHAENLEAMRLQFFLLYNIRATVVVSSACAELPPPDFFWY